MNFNSKILKVSIVIALVLMLIPIVAAEDTTDSVYAEEQSIDDVAVQAQDEITDDSLLVQEDQDELSDDDLEDEDLGLDDEDEELTDDETEDVDVTGIEDSSADLEIVSFVTPKKVKVGDYAIFTFMVYNHGPDTARTVQAYANIFKGDVLFISYSTTHGLYDSYSGLWDIGDLEDGEYATLMVLGKILSDAPIITMAYVTSDTPDPDESNNYFIDVIYVEGESVAAETETLPATGNPILMALLAVLAMVGVTVGRKK